MAAPVPTPYSRRVFHTIRLSDGRTLEYVDLGDPGGAPVLQCHGTPGTAGVAAIVADVARAHGVRLVAPSRPGYGASTPSPPGLASCAADAVELADQLGIGRFAAMGISGGGPFALALGAVAPARITTVFVHAGSGPYFELMPPSEEDAEERRAMSIFAGGDVDGGVAAMTASADKDFGPMRGLGDAEVGEALKAMVPAGETWVEAHPPAEELFNRDFNRAISTSPGYVRDILSWGGAWDIDLTTMVPPVRMVYGESDEMVPTAHAEWLRERLPHADLVVVPGGHGEVSFGRAGETFAAVAAAHTD
jgi:pimeloyl-ACP methyl ester carboxylesterase